MSDFLISDFFEPIIIELSGLDPKLKKTYDKVKCRFKEFAESKGLTLNTLRLYHICRFSGAINVRFTEFLNAARRKVKSARPHADHRREVWANAKRVVAAVTGQKSPKDDLSLAERLTPPWMEPILDLLPRDIPLGYRKKFRIEGTHRNYPLTINAEMLLESFLTVSKKYDIEFFEKLPADFIGETRAEIRKTPRGVSSRNILQTLSALLRKLGLTNANQPSGGIKFNDLSPKLKRQFDIYKKLAVKKVEKNSDLGAFGSLYKIKFYQANENTIAQTKSDLERGLAYCGALPENLGIEDLLALKERKVTVFGMEKIEKYNEFVESYREREQNRVSGVKRAGFDSDSFVHFKKAVVSVAKYNGFFSLIEEFCRVYWVSLDFESKLKKKTDKKSAFALKQLDSEIEKLGERFFGAVRHKLFLPHPDRSVSETEEELKLCLYYPVLLVLRFTGLRQKNVRNCRMMRDPENYDDPGGNIGIKKDGTLVFHFTEDETKNRKKLHAEFNLEQHSETHGALIRGMTRYLKKVRPFVVSSRFNDVRNQCFAYIPDTDLMFQKFNESCGRQFYSIFVSWNHRYLEDFLNTPERHKIILNPHFFRGVCCDWLHDVLKFTFDQIGEYIGDTAETVRTQYINRNRVHDVTHHVTLKNIELRLTKTQEKDRDTFFESIMKRYHHLEQENDQNKDKVKLLEEKIREQERQINELRAKTKDPKKEKADLQKNPEEDDPPDQWFAFDFKDR